MQDNICKRCGNARPPHGHSGPMPRYMVTSAERHNVPTSRGQDRVQHLDFTCAQAEADRLATQTPGRPFWVAQIITAAFVPLPTGVQHRYFR